VKTFWQFLCSRSCEVVVRVETIPITPDLLGDYSNDPRFQEHFQDWLNRLWQDKDRAISDFFKIKDKAA
jgi:hypothetical protein